MSVAAREGSEAFDQSGSVRRNAYERFQERLMAGTIRPGQMLSQRELVDMLDISLGALRELLPRLEAEGLVVVRPQRGIQIPSVDLTMIRNAYQMRMAFEREAVVSAISSISDAALLEQRRLHADILARAASDSSDGLMAEAQEVDNGMHAFLIGATRNDLLIQAYAINSVRVRLINIDRMRITPAVLPKALGYHMVILDAILARDTFAAIRAMDEHITDARNRAVAF